LIVLAKQRSLARARENVILAWRTAAYGRVKRMPSLEEELEALTWTDDDDDDDEDRVGQMMGKIKMALLAWNAHFDAEERKGQR
jgi:hypothetical protein